MLAYLVDAFTNKLFTGNRAGVVFDADSISQLDKQLIASEIGASETAFVSKSTIADYKVEYFTPATAIDFCGHATIATSYMLAELGKVSTISNITLETKIGIIPITISRINGQTVVTMTQRKPQFAMPTENSADIAKALNLNTDQLDNRFPIKLSNTGNWHLLVGVNSKECLDSITYDDSLLSKILSKYQAVTAHVFCAVNQKLYYARNFCPTVGISEDPATGSAAGAFGAYLAHEKLLNDGTNELQIIQGEAMGRPSQITVSIKSQSGDIEEVQVSGTAVSSFTLSMQELAVPISNWTF